MASASPRRAERMRNSSVLLSAWTYKFAAPLLLHASAIGQGMFLLVRSEGVHSVCRLGAPFAGRLGAEKSLRKCVGPTVEMGVG
jgi:hypothetical protein